MFDNLSYKRKTHEILHQQHLLAFFLLCKLFCELAEHRHTNAYETLHKIGCTSAKRSNKFCVLPSVCTIFPQALLVSVQLGKQRTAYPAWRTVFLEVMSYVSVLNQIFGDVLKQMTCFILLHCDSFISFSNSSKRINTGPKYFSGTLYVVAAKYRIVMLWSLHSLCFNSSFCFCIQSLITNHNLL